jgi:hypothetical protein
MKPKIPDDLLSAFLDREVTPDEETLARQHLQSSPQARQEFQDYQRLGELLHELPRRTVPTEFAAAVMQQAERETLIPLETVGATAVDSQSRRPSRRTWIAASVGLAATAAAVLVVVNLPPRQDAVAVRDTTLAKSPRFEARLAKSAASIAPAAPLAAAGKPLVVAKDATPEMASPEIDAAIPRLRVARAAASPAPTLVSNAPMKPSEAGASRLVFPADLKSAQEGDVVEALESVGNQVAVVRLMLVNQTTALGGLQNLLVRDASRPVQGAEKEKLLKGRFAAAKGSVVVDAKTVSNGPGELICVFVEVSRDELVGVLRDVQNESQIQRAQLTNAISAAKLAEYAKRPVTTASLGGDASAARAQTLSLPHAAVDKITGASTAGKELDRQSAVASTAGKSLSRVSSSIAGKFAQASVAPAQQSAQQSVPAKKDQAGALKGKQLVAGTQRSFQVFFVLDDQNVTESQSAEKAPAADQGQVAPRSSPAVHPRAPVRAKRPGRKRVVKPTDDSE